MDPSRIDSVLSLTGGREEDEKLLQPYLYILQVPGKLIRAKLAHAFNYWLQIPAEKLAVVSEIVQMLHNASLLIDDIQDNSVLRRGIPVAHSIFGVASTINSANYVMFIGLEKVLTLKHNEAISVYSEQLLELHRGQGMEIYWRDNFSCPSEEEYKTMVIRKTGGLFMLAIRLMQLFSDNKSNFKKLTELLGLYLQIRDDYCNLRSAEYTSNKSYCEDLTEGKFSYPIIHGIRSHPEDSQIINILRQRTTDVEVKRHCIKLLDKFGSFDHTRTVLLNIDKSIREEVQRIGENPLMISLIDELLSWDQMAENP
ncbi:hypothetical protein V9T40_005993 [Parthenolecanium corni]|uniref:Geranylgeranyl pyrophosphate synthase n=1 Tax=Parthenolecanium corni TaxID=536013 RepID=A0AAN9TTX3_9HEMI